MAIKGGSSQQRPFRVTPPGARPHDGKTRQPRPGRGRPAKYFNAATGQWERPEVVAETKEAA